MLRQTSSGRATVSTGAVWWPCLSTLVRGPGPGASRSLKRLRGEHRVLLKKNGLRKKRGGRGESRESVGGSSERPHVQDSRAVRRRRLARVWYPPRKQPAKPGRPKSEQGSGRGRDRWGRMLP